MPFISGNPWQISNTMLSKEFFAIFAPVVEKMNYFVCYNQCFMMIYSNQHYKLYFSISR